MIEMDRKLHDQESSKIFTVWVSVLQIFGDKIVKLILIIALFLFHIRYLIRVLSFYFSTFYSNDEKANRKRPG